jgi:hypothetical protein
MMPQRNVLKLYAFRRQYPNGTAMLEGWNSGDSFCLTALPHPTSPELLSVRDIGPDADARLNGFTHVALTDLIMGCRVIVDITQEPDHAAQFASAEAPSRGAEQALPQGEDGVRLDGCSPSSVRVQRQGEAVHEDGQLQQTALTILAAMMASPANAEMPIATMVDKSIEAAAADLHKIYGCD